MTDLPEFGAAGDAGRRTTGSFLVLLPEDESGQGVGMDAVRNATGATIASSADWSDAGPPEAADADGMLFPELGVAVVDVPPDAAPSLMAAGRNSSAVLVVEPEQIMRALDVEAEAGVRQRAAVSEAQAQYV